MISKVSNEGNSHFEFPLLFHFFFQKYLQNVPSVYSRLPNGDMPANYSLFLPKVIILSKYLCKLRQEKNDIKA